MGDFTLPIYAVNSPLKLDSLLRTLVYTKKGTHQEIQSTINIIKPFFKTIKEHVVNRKVIKALEDIQDDVSKKYIALGPTKKK